MNRTPAYFFLLNQQNIPGDRPDFKRSLMDTVAKAVNPSVTLSEEQKQSVLLAIDLEAKKEAPSLDVFLSIAAYINGCRE